MNSGYAAIQDILVVEDDPGVGRAVARALGRAGYRVQLARRCQAALELAGDFELAVLDLDLPDGSGVALAEQLLGSGRTRAVVFYSASADAVHLARARALGEVVAKSATTSALLEVVARAVSGSLSALRPRDNRVASFVRR